MCFLHFTLRAALVFLTVHSERDERERKKRLGKETNDKFRSFLFFQIRHPLLPRRSPRKISPLPPLPPLPQIGIKLPEDALVKKVQIAIANGYQK